MSTIDHHEKLVAWQLADDLKRRVLALIARPELARHFRFCDQIRESSRSAPANLAEGFWRYYPRENARSVRTAIGSLGETLHHLRDGFSEGYFAEPEFRTLTDLAERAIRASIGWHRYLTTCPDRPPGKPRERSERSERAPTRSPAPAPGPERVHNQSQSQSQSQNQNQNQNREPEPQTRTANQPKTKNPKPKTD